MKGVPCRRLGAAAALCTLLLPAWAGAGSPPAPGGHESPKDLYADVGLDQRIGEKVPLDATLRDEDGREVRVGDLLDGKPAVLVFAYYECPMLCTYVLNGLLGSLREVSLDAGKDFEVIVVSINPEDTPQTAAAKKDDFVHKYDRPGSGAGWHFLTGTESQVRRLASAAGFRYRRIEENGQYAHAAGIIVLSPDGTISRYLLGVEYPPRDLRLALVEAGRGRTGGLADQILLLCYCYDPSVGRYSLAITNTLRVAGVLTILGLGGLILLLLRAERRRARS